jgi:ADP-ribosyl-[dinitrogen reductase] hydrolase
MNSPSLQSRHRGCLLGLACGDAVGTTVEFAYRGTFAPVTEMVGGGPFHLPAGAWTDDTSMALCLATSLIDKKGFDPVDQMERYCKWNLDGYLSSVGRCFDIGGTTRNALRKFMYSKEPFSGETATGSAGNGSIMRLAPVPMFFYPDRAQTITMCGESSRTTHGAAECIEGCKLFGGILHAALGGASREEALFQHGVDDLQCASIRAIAAGEYRNKSIEEIVGSGYVVKSLEAALWCFLKSSSFEEAILTATNLGDDADTTAAVCGQIAGAHYGEEGIPPSWLQKLVMCDEIRSLADRLYAA